MNAAITVTDGVTSRTYNSLGGIETVDKNKRRHVRKTDERDASPEMLVMQQEQLGLNTRTHVELPKTKVDGTTGKQYVGRAYFGFSGDITHFSQTDIELAFTELVAILAVSGMKTDLALGKL